MSKKNYLLPTLVPTDSYAYIRAGTRGVLLYSFIFLFITIVIINSVITIIKYVYKFFFFFCLDPVDMRPPTVNGF